MIEDQSTLRWELESVFPGGPGGDAFADFLSEGFRRAEALIARVDALPMLSEDPANLAAWATALLAAEALNTDTSEAYGFASAWACARALDADAERMESRAQELWSRLQRAQVGLRDGVARCDDGAYAALRALPDLNGVAAALDNRRARAALLLPRAEEALACDLARDGLNAWGQLYDRVAGTLTVTLPDGETLSGSQVRNAMGSADRGRRRAVSTAASSAWAGIGKTCAAALSHIVGARQVLNDRRGVDEDLAAFRAAVEGAESQIPS